MKKTVIFSFKPLIIITAVFISLFLFQNCSDIKVSQKPELQQPSLVANAKPNASLCAPKGTVFGSPIRIVIVLDMSMSNIGTVETTYSDSDPGVAHYFIDTTDGPTDLNGQRFDQVKNFIESCGGNVNVKYAIFGFSKEAQFARGQSCEYEFESQDDALRTLEAFKQQQLTDIKVKNGRGNYPFYLGNETRYDRAIECLEKKIRRDLVMLYDEKPEYHTFILTDGLPDGDTSILVPKINQLSIDTQADASGLHFNSIFYTSPGAKNQSQVTAAKAVLDPMTQATEGISAQTMVLSDLTSAQSQLCSKIQPGTQVNYSLKTMYAVNLTAKMIKNNLFADSDMDGVSDDIEKSLAWDPVNYRSSGVIDGLCFLDGKDKSACAVRVQALGCVNAGFNFGMSDCDRNYAKKIYGSSLASVDADRDLIPNYIEIIRNTAPLRADMFDNPSADGILNLEKIKKGMDIFSSQQLWPVEQSKLMEVSYQADAGTCPSGTQQLNYSINNVPVVQTLAYMDPSDDPLMNLSHQENENVVLVVSVWQSIGGVTLPNRVYIQKWIVPINGAPKSNEIQFVGEF